MSTLEMYRAATREVLVRKGEPLKTSALVANVYSVLDLDKNEDRDGLIIASMHALHAEGEIEAEATATQTLWSIEVEPHQCWACEEYLLREAAIPCQPCIDDCARCATVRDSVKCDHNGVFARSGGWPEWCSHCSRWVPYADL